MVEELNGRCVVAVGVVIEHTPTGRVLVLKRADGSDFEAERGFVA